MSWLPNIMSLDIVYTKRDHSIFTGFIELSQSSLSEGKLLKNKRYFNEFLYKMLLNWFVYVNHYLIRYHYKIHIE
jgi:hypothetical protein